MKIKRHLVIMAKTPQVGLVKSRLAADIGLIPAWTFYRRNLQNLFKEVRKCQKWKTYLFITPDNLLNQSRLWEINTPKLPQGHGNLGQRMNKIMKILPIGPVVIVGTDIPDLKTKHIEAAFNMLEIFDVVFGPATDGGFWLIGQRRRPKLIQLFENVRWSSPNTLSDTIKNLPKTSTFKMLELLTDIDDLNSFKEREKMLEEKHLPTLKKEPPNYNYPNFLPLPSL